MFLKILLRLRPTNRSTNESTHIMKMVYFKTYLYNFWANSNGAKYYFKKKTIQFFNLHQILKQYKNGQVNSGQMLRFA